VVVIAAGLFAVAFVFLLWLILFASGMRGTAGGRACIGIVLSGRADLPQPSGEIFCLKF
jgi:acid phosphatase family membrane protein YuiD